MTIEETGSAPAADKGASWKRWAPLGVILAAGGAAAYFFGDALSFETLSANREALLAWRDQDYLLAAATFTAVYAAVVALSLPGAIWMTLTGGFLFGLWPGVAFNVLAATLGAIAIFAAAKTSLGATLKERAGPWLEKIEAGFRRDEISYLLMMRLVPAIPFFIANLAPAFLGVRLWTFGWTTLLGILPGAAVYTWVGAGLGDILDAGGEPDLSIIFEPHVLGPLLGLAALSAAPIIIRRLRKGGPDGADAANEEAQS